MTSIVEREMVEGSTKKQSEAREEARRQSGPLLEGLREAGVCVTDVHDIKYPDDYPQCIKPLVDHLGSCFHPNIFVGMWQKLSVEEAKVHLDQIVSGYSKQEDDTNKGLIANAIIALVDRDSVDSVDRALIDPSNGDSRSLIIRGIAKKLRGERRRDFLERYVDLDDRAGATARELLAKKSSRIKRRSVKG